MGLYMPQCGGPGCRLGHCRRGNFDAMLDARRHQYMRLKAEVLHLRLLQANLVASGTKRAIVERLLSHESSQKDVAWSHSPADSDQSGSNKGSSSSQHLEEASPAATSAPVTSRPSTQRVEPACRASTRWRRSTGHDFSSGGAPTGMVASKQRVDPRRAHTSAAPVRPHRRAAAARSKVNSPSGSSVKRSPSPVRGRSHRETAPGSSRRHARSRSSRHRSCSPCPKRHCYGRSGFGSSSSSSSGGSSFSSSESRHRHRRHHRRRFSSLEDFWASPFPSCTSTPAKCLVGGFEEVNLLTLISYWVQQWGRAPAQSWVWRRGRKIRGQGVGEWWISLPGWKLGTYIWQSGFRQRLIRL